MENLIVWFIIISSVILFIFIVKRKNSNKRKAIKKQKEKEQENYERYLNRFDDISRLSKLDIQLTKVAGTKYSNDDSGINRQEIIKNTKEGELLMLVPDELNRFDNSAIKIVRLNGEQIGFLDMDISVEIKSRLLNQSPIEAKILKISKEKGNFEVEITLQRYSRKMKQKP